MHEPTPESEEGHLVQVLKNPRNWLGLPEEEEESEKSDGSGKAVVPKPDSNKK